jgi:hypothetical protein
MTERASDPLAAVRNLAAKAWRRAAAVPKRGVRMARRADRLREQAAAFGDEWQVERDIGAVARGRGPIIAGPWLSEVGFEVLYWIPFLRWFEDRYRIDPERVIAVSRGGVAGWYGDLAARYVEIFDHVTPEEFARRNRERQQRGESGGQKQTTIGAFDEELISAARAATNVPQAAICHPSLMYRLFSRFWYGNRALDLVTSHTRFDSAVRGCEGASVRSGTAARSHPRTPAPLSLGLPERYIAAKFYTGAALPGTPEARGALRELVRAAAIRMPVVMLDTGMATDEHEDYLFRDIPNVTSLRDRLSPATNLGVQTAAIAGAQQFIGTCGSLAWLAPLLGVDTLAVYSEERFLVSHIFFAAQAYRHAGTARFDTLDLRALTELDLLASAAAVAQGRS